MKISVLSKRETSEILDKMTGKWNVEFIPKIKTLKSYEVEDGKRILVSDELTVVQVKDNIIPFLGDSEMVAKFPSIYVDMGAVRFVCNGAKVMRPGIRKFDLFKKGDIVVVKDETHGKTLAIGLSLEDSEAVTNMTKGYVVDNLHYISDKIWEGYKEIKN